MKDNLAGKIEELMSEPRSSVSRKVYAIMKPKSTGYVALREQVNSLVLHQALLDKAIRGNDSAFCNIYYATKGFFYQFVLGERQLCIDELFDVQLDSMFELNFNLRSITSSSRDELSSLRDYYGGRHHELVKCVNAIDSTSSELEKATKDYAKVKQNFGSLRKKDAKYFGAEFRMRELKREVSEKVHYYDVVNESVLDLAEELRFLEVVEDLLMSSIHLSDNIAVKSKRIERHIASTKQAYTLVKSQQLAAESLDKALTNLTRFTLGVHNLLADGLRGMSDMMGSSSNINKFYSSGIKGLGSLVSSVSEANLMRSQEVENAVQKYLSSVA